MVCQSEQELPRRRSDFAKRRTLRFDDALLTFRFQQHHVARAQLHEVLPPLLSSDSWNPKFYYLHARDGAVPVSTHGTMSHVRTVLNLGTCTFTATEERA
eukprot:SAG31_NODE_2012_length_6668_cov_5.925407_9_plen_100_part_00